MIKVDINNASDLPKKNIREIENAMDREGWYNPYLRLAILSTVAKESRFTPKNEKSYRNTSNQRLRELFGSRLSNYTESQLNELKKDDVAFFEAIYGGRYGNSQYGDGYKYRGRGFNQLTFKSSYEEYAKKTGHPIDKKPDLLNNVKVASDVLIAFFNDRLENIPNQTRFPVKNIDNFQDKDTAIYTVVSANAGWGKDVRSAHPETLKKAQEYSKSFSYPKNVYDVFSKYGINGVLDRFYYNTAEFIKRNWIPLSITTLTLAIGAFVVIKKIWK